MKLTTIRCGRECTGAMNRKPYNAPPPMRISCSTIWGGNAAVDTALCTAGINASVYSAAADGGRGGDICFMTVCSADELTRVAVADVVGHGEKVAKVSSWLYRVLEQYLNSDADDGLLASLNGIAVGHGLSALTTAAIVTFDNVQRAMRCTYAGHPPAYFFRKGAASWRPLTVVDGEAPSNLPLGVLNEVRYSSASTFVQPGDKICLYTDGVLETPSREGAPFGEEGLVAALNQVAHESTDTIKDRIRAALTDHARREPDHDDVTVMILEVR